MRIKESESASASVVGIPNQNSESPFHYVRRRARGIALALAVALASISTVASSGGGKGFIWRVERDGRIGWLVGSIHVLTPDYYPLPQTMQRAFARATTLLEEADIGEMGSPEVLQLLRTKATYGSGESLQTQVSPETYRLVSERAAKFGLPMAALERMRPWMMTLTLVANEIKTAGFDPALGVDRHFYEQAQPTGKSFRTLETLAEQLGFFADLAPALQEAMLRDSLLGLDAEIGQLPAMAKAWQSGDTATLERVMLAPIMKERTVYEALIVARNRNWLPKIEGCLADGGCFVVVGAAHLLGPDGLLDALRQKGYTVEQE